MNTIPRNIEAQGKKAEDLQKQLMQGNEITPDANQQPAAPIVPAQPIDQPAVPIENELTPVPQPAEKKTYEQLVEENRQLTESSKEWENKFKSLHGKTSKDMPFLRKQNEQLTNSIANLQTLYRNALTEIETLRQHPGGNGQSPQSGLNSINPEAFKEYGDEFVQMAMSVNNLVSQLNQAKATSQPMQGGSTQTTDQQQCYQKARSRVPLFDRVNHDPEFVQVFLNEIDDETGMLKGEKLQSMLLNLDANGIVAIFNEFIASGRMTPLEAPEQTITPPGQPINPIPVRPRNNISITPDTSLGGNPPQINPQAHGERYTRSQVNKFFTDVSKGRWGAEYQTWIDAKTADIQRAFNEGRVDTNR